MKRVDSPAVIVPMLRVTYAPDVEPTFGDRPRRPRIRPARRKGVSLTGDKQADAFGQVRARLLKMIVENERERSHDHRAS